MIKNINLYISFLMILIGGVVLLEYWKYVIKAFELFNQGEDVRIDFIKSWVMPFILLIIGLIGGVTGVVGYKVNKMWSLIAVISNVILLLTTLVIKGFVEVNFK